MFSTLIFLSIFTLSIIYAFKRFSNGIAVLFICKTFEKIFLLRNVPIINIATVSIYISDALSFLFFIIFFLRYSIFKKKKNKYKKIIFFYLIYLIIIQLLSYQSYGFFSFRQSQGFFWFISLIFYASVFNIKEDDIKKLVLYLRYFVVFLIFLYFFRISGLLQIPSQAMYSKILHERLRYLLSDSVLCILAYFNFLIIKNKFDKMSIMDHIIMYLSLIIIFIIPYRTIWLILIIALLYHLLKFYNISLKQITIFLFISIIFFPILTNLLSNKLSVISNSFLNPILSVQESTGYARIISWLSIINQDTNPVNVIFGNGFGYNIERIIGDKIVSYSIHNTFVAIYYFCGLIGLLFLSYIFLVPIFSRRNTFEFTFIKWLPNFLFIWMLISLITSITGIGGFFLAIPYAIFISKFSKEKNGNIYNNSSTQ